MFKAYQILMLSFIATGVLIGCSQKVETYVCSTPYGSKQGNLTIEGDKAVLNWFSEREPTNLAKCKSEQGIDSYAFVEEGCGKKDRMRNFLFNTKVGTLGVYEHQSNKLLEELSCIKGPITQAVVPASANATITTPAPDPAAPEAEPPVMALPAEPVVPAVPIPEGPVTSTQTIPQISKNVEYPAFRKSLIGTGWIPVKQSKECGIICQGQRKDGFIETQDCADTGLAPCIFIFKNNDGKMLKIHTAGENLAVQKTVGDK